MSEEAKRTINRPAYKERAENAEAMVKTLQKEVRKLRENGSSDVDVAKIKAEAFSAGVASVSSYLSK